LFDNFDFPIFRNDISPKFRFLAKISISDPKVQFLTEISIFEFDFWAKFRFLTKISIFTKSSIFDQKFDFWSKFRFFTKSSAFDRNFDFWRKICFFSKFSLRSSSAKTFLIQLFSQAAYLTEEFKIFSLFNVYKVDENFDFWPAFRFLTNISSFDQNFYFWPKFRFLTKIWIFYQNFDFWPKFRFLKKVSIFRESKLTFNLLFLTKYLKKI